MPGLLAPQVPFRYVDNNGNALVGGKVHTYINESTTPQATYSDAALTALNTNPVTLDSRGECMIYLLPGKAYTFEITNALGTVINTIDDIYGASPAGAGAWIDITAYGADKTGVADSRAAVLAAIAAASTAKTVIYAPAGTYKILGNTITNAGAPDFMGIVGDSQYTSIFSCTSHTDDAFRFTNIPAGSRYENFRINGPGQIVEDVTSSGLVLLVDGGGTYAGVYNTHMENVAVADFPTDGFYWTVPFVCTFNKLLAQKIGRYGFFVDIRVNPNIGGTSTTFNSCYANDVLNTGYYIKAHAYSAMNSCAADTCNISYHLDRCEGMTLNSCGNEANTYIDAGHPGIGVKLSNSSSAIVINGYWCYYMPNVASYPLYIENSSNCVINSFFNLKETVLTNYDAYASGGSTSRIEFNSCESPNRTPTDFLVNDVLGINTTNIIRSGRYSGPATFNKPDSGGNCLYITGGAVDMHADAGDGKINLYTTGNFDYPAASITNQAKLVFGDGVAASDVIFSRTGAGVVSLTSPLGTGGFDGILNIIGSSNPQLYITNTGASQEWAISAGNDGGLAFYDAINARSPLYVWPVNGVSGENGLCQMSHGWKVAGGGQLHVEDAGNSASGSAVFPGATSVVVSNTLVTANSRIFVTIQELFSGSGAAVYVSSKTAGVGFTISSTSSLDANVAYLITEP